MRSEFILALGSGKVRVAMDLLYPITAGSGEQSVKYRNAGWRGFDLGG